MARWRIDAVARARGDTDGRRGFVGSAAGDIAAASSFWEPLGGVLSYGTVLRGCRVGPLGFLRCRLEWRGLGGDEHLGTHGRELANADCAVLRVSGLLHGYWFNVAAPWRAPFCGGLDRRTLEDAARCAAGVSEGRRSVRAFVPNTGVLRGCGGEAQPAKSRGSAV